jgi:hypothetical protein
VLQDRRRPILRQEKRQRRWRIRGGAEHAFTC